MLVNFDTPGICLHDGGSICLVPRIRTTGSLGPRGWIYWSSRMHIPESHRFQHFINIHTLILTAFGCRLCMTYNVLGFMH